MTITYYDPVELVVPQIVRDRGNGDVRYVLDGVEYGFRWRYNERAGRWFLGIDDADTTAIVDGIAVVCAFPLLDLLTDSRRPPGELMVLDDTNGHATPGLDDLGVSAKVLYWPTVET